MELPLRLGIFKIVLDEQTDLSIFLLQAPSLSGKGDDDMDTSDAGVMFNMGGSAGYPAGYTQDQVEGRYFYTL